MSHEEFKQLQPSLTSAFAVAIEATLEKMGEDAKGISWFSSSAQGHVKNA